jgi:outer membrane receptor protein involved in Fe transport
VALATLTGDSGPWFELPGGPVGMVVGAEWRQEKSRFVNDEYAVEGYGFQFAADSNVTGKFDVTEAFVEVSMPLLADLPFFDRLTLDASYRTGEYSLSGTAEAWKVGVVWAPIEDVRIRANLAETIRAPNIGELFTPETASTFRPVDPCDQANRNSGPSPANRAANCTKDGIPASFTDPLTARFTGVFSGNPNLDPETSESYTVGLILMPRFLPGFTASFDYWNIEIANAVASISAQNIVDGCYDAPSLDNQFCKLFTRNRNAGSPTFLGFNFLRQTSVNFAGLEVSGVDFDLNYRLETETNGGFTFGVSGSYLEKRDNFEFFGEPNRANPEKLELNNPEWVVNATVGWKKGPLGVAVNSTWWDQQLYRVVEIETKNDTFEPFAPAVWVHNLSASYELNESVTLFGGINNLADERPFRTEYSIPVSAVGREVFLRASMKF